jgi:acetylornithine/succinyldiaminopimelate/putrescine aminotransferase
MTQRELFLKHIAQTSPSPIGIEVTRAEGSMIWDKEDKSYLDLIAGISVCNVGHRHPKVVEAIKHQADAYLHVLVYGEMIESPQVQYATLLTNWLPPNLNSVYFTNSGAEAVEGAMKLAKRVTNRTEIIAFEKSYHGSTQGALSLMGDEYWRNAFRPLLPGIRHLPYNDESQLSYITEETAAVILEPVQAERGVIAPDVSWMQALRKKCDDTGTLLVLDEIQTGFGRTGLLWAFEHFGIVPDILLLGKALGGGLPLGAFIADKDLMWTLTENPLLGHITTFGGHPLSCAAGMAAMKVLIEQKLVSTVNQKSELFKSMLRLKNGRPLRKAGLLMALEFDSFEENKAVIDCCLGMGVLTDWFLFAPNCLRIAPPLTISDAEIRLACDVINTAMH